MTEISIKDLTDEQIIVELQGLDEKRPEFSLLEKRYAKELYIRYYRQAINLSRYYGLSRADAEDAAQESFIKLFKHIKSFNADQKFKPWFFKLVLNKVKDLYGSLKKTRGHSDLDDIEETADLSGVSVPDKIIEKVQNQEYINGIIECLPSKYKNVIILRIYAEMSFEEMAPLVGVGSRQVRKRLDKALRMVRSCLKEKKWAL